IATLGIGLAWVVPQVVNLVAKTAKDIASLVANLTKALGELGKLLGKAGDLFGSASSGLKKLTRGSMSEGGKIDDVAGGKNPVPVEGKATASGASSHGRIDPGPLDAPPKLAGSDDTTPSGTGSKGDPLGSGKPLDESTPPPARSAGGDPVDLVTGQMFIDQEDLELPGLLPVLFERTHVSGYRKGRWFGLEWASTLDQRVEIDDDGIHYAAPDGVVLHYPHPSGADDLVMPVEGVRWPLRWNRNTDTILIGRPESKLTFSFPPGPVPDGARPLETVGDLHGNWMTFSHDAMGVPTDLRHSGGYHVRIGQTATEAGSRISDLRLVQGGGSEVTVVSFGYDRLGRLATVADSRGRPMTFEYDDQDRVVAWFDRVGQTYRYLFDDTGRVVRTEGTGDFLTAEFAYDLDARVTTFTDSLGQVSRYHWNELNQVTKVVDPLGGVTLTEYDRNGLLLSKTDPMGRTRRLRAHDGFNGLRLEGPDGTATDFVFEAVLGQPTQVTGPDGTVWHRTYDETGALRSERAPSGQARGYEYGERGELVAVTDELGQVTRYRNNAAGLPVAVVEPSGATTSYERDDFGRITAVTNPLGAVTRLGWTIEGSQTWRVEADGARDEWAYDAEGNMIEHRGPAGAVTRFEYGPFGEIITRVDPSGARYTFAYDTEMRMRTVTGPTGLTWQYEYDAVGNLLVEKDFDGGTRSYTYDAAGQLVRRVNGAGQWSTYRYDQQGRLVERRNEHGVYERTYDVAGRVTSARGPEHLLEFSYDEVGRITAETLNGRRTSYTYDAVGRVVQRRTPSGAISKWTHDQSGRPLSLVAAGGRLTFERDARGLETARRVGADVTLRQRFDAVGRVTHQAIHTRHGGARQTASHPLHQRTFSYRADGSPVQITDQIRGSRSFELDALGRITEVRASGWTESYAYDVLGNLVHADTPAAPSTAERRYSGTLAQQVGDASYEHDGEGRVVSTTRRGVSGRVQRWRYSWDSDDHLVSVTTPDGSVWEYLYDTFDRRIAKRCLARDGNPVIETWFAWDGSRLAEQTVTSGSRSDVTTWDWYPGTHRVVAQSRRRSARTSDPVDVAFHAIVTDLVGTPTELVAPDGRVAWHSTDVWGVDFSRPVGEADFPLRFPGQYRDTETGLNYNLHRYYDPATASYLSSDPLGLNPAPNNHAYIGNPLTELDPLGLTPTCLKGLMEKLRNPFKTKQQGKANEPQPGPSTPPDQLYRWDGNGNPGRTPQDIAGQGGFAPWKPDANIKPHEHVYNSLDTGEGIKFQSNWVSAAEWKGLTDPRIGIANPYLYRIDPTKLDGGNLVDINSHMAGMGKADHPFAAQHEWAHNGKIPLDAITGYLPAKEAQDALFPPGPNKFTIGPPQDPSTLNWRPMPPPTASSSVAGPSAAEGTGES
ncbi:MAG TPA: DUF6531 domain-containing protein, partial [Pseudonocardia sp.]|nr:DUF6531 domain-containing protein [Pseudonocardia sp.]